MMSDDTDDSGELLLDGPFDPDAQATVTDFIDYTEYLPADLIRSLTLIRQLDERYLAAAQTVHELTKTYGQLPDIPPESRPNIRALRKEISRQLDRAINARESAYAESCRLYDVVDRHFERLDCIKKKLYALPKPPSREPTPAPAPVSPENKRSRTGRKGEDGASTTRITLRVDGQDQKSRSRRSLLTGGHGFNPDSPIASTEQSDVEAETQGSLDTKVAKPKKEKQPKRPRANRPSGMGTNVHSSVAGISTSNALALLKPPPEDAKMGSEDLPWLRLTEWEMTKLRKKMKKNAVWQPSEIMIHRELALRGRGWEGYRAAKAAAEADGTEFIDCDDIMNNYVPGKLIRKTEAGGEAAAVEETKLSNRGMKLNEAKKLKRETLAREQAALAAAEAELAAKRLGDIGSTFKSLFPTPGDSAHGAPGQPGTSQKANGAAGKEKEKAKTPKKRKLEETAVSEPSAPTQETEAKSAKKRKPSKSTPVATNVEENAAQEKTVAVPEPEISTTAPAAPTAPSSPPKKPSPVPSAKAPTPPAAPSVPSAPPAAESVAAPVAPAAAPVSKPTTTPTPPTTRPPSRRRSAAHSAEPVSSVIHTGLREGLRRKSATPAKTPVPEPIRPPSAPATTAASRRSKRPAPGPVSSGQDGGAAVSYGRRKAKPAKKKATSREPGPQESSVAPKEDVRIDEDGVLEEIDPNEPRYCLCGDVSFGTMICCENNDVSNHTIPTFDPPKNNTNCFSKQCDKEWFHLDCVGLSEVPSRTAKWYCPDCRVKLGKGPNGIVKVGSRR